MTADNPGVTPPAADVPAVDPSVVEVDRGPDATAREAFGKKVVGILGSVEPLDADALVAAANAKATKVLDEVSADAQSGPGADPNGIWIGKADRGPGVYEFKPIKLNNEPIIPLKLAQKFDGSELEVDPTTVLNLSNRLTDLGSAIEANYGEKTPVNPEVPPTNAQ